MDLTPDEFVGAFNLNEQRHDDTVARSWQQTRFIAYSVASPYLEKPRPTAKEWFPLPWDEPDKPKEQYNREEGRRRFDELKNKWN